MKIATDIASWAVDARKHGMTYGQYVQTVEHGKLPPPKAKRTAKSHKIIRTCVKCGGEFEVHKRISDGYVSQTQYCPDCRFNSQHGFLRRH